MNAIKTCTTKYVVVCSIYMNGKYIEFVPGLPLVHNLFSKCYQGGYWKGYAFFDEYFWRKYGFSGEIMTDSKNGPIVLCLDKDTSILMRIKV